MQNKIAIVIPVYNEEKNLKILLPQIFKYNKNILVIIVDDNSTDNTSSFVKKYNSSNTDVVYLHRKAKLGRGSAIVYGFKYAYEKSSSSVFIEMDGDLSHDPKEIAGLAALTNEKTISLASRYIPKSKVVGISLSRKIVSKIVNMFETTLFHLPIHDYTNGFRAYPRNAVKLLIKYKYKSSGFAAIAESSFFLHSKGFGFSEQPTFFVNRTIGGSKVDIHELYISIRDLLRVRFF